MADEPRESDDSGDSAAEEKVPGAFAVTKDKISALFFLAFSIAYGAMALDLPSSPFASQDVFTNRTMPYALSVLGIVVSFLMLVLPPKDPQPTGKAAFAGWGGFAWPQVAALAVNMVAYGFLLSRIGFISSTTIFLIFGYLILGERRPLLVLVASAPVVVAFWAILTQLLGIYLAPDFFFAWFQGGEG
jgi:putative tricarboxylic transport membrane protein